MVNVYQAVLKFLPLYLSGSYLHDVVVQESHASKSIAVVGAGSAGLAMLKTFIDLPEEMREGWTISLLEQREDVGGIW